MNTQDSLTEVVPDTVPNEISVGEMLRNKRIVKYYSVDDIAKRLRLSPNTIKALEEDDYSSLPGDTFVRGYLRSYAKVVDIPEESVMSRFQNSVMQEPELVMPPVTLFKKQASVNDRSVRWLSYLILFVLATLVVMWWRSHQAVALQTDELGNAQDVTAAQTLAPSDTTTANNASNHAQPAVNTVQQENIPPISGFEAGINDQANPQIAQKMVDDDKQLNADRLVEGGQSVVASTPASSPKKTTTLKSVPENNNTAPAGLASTRNLSLVEETNLQPYPSTSNIEIESKLHMNGFGNE